ncbi:glycoside hydrolase family 3 C-terminal domain-containing protein [bacterium]|nr:glycoside hydrolase family 3 C-terminal domain-containing protein [bacterium]
MTYRIIMLCMLVCPVLSGRIPIYKDTSVPVEQRLDDLIHRMTVEEKAGQLFSFGSRDTLAFDGQGNFISTQDTAIIHRGLGAFFSWGMYYRKTPRQQAMCINGLQKYMIENTRLGIPVFMFNESLHGLTARGATSFPQAIALGCTFDTTLVEAVFTVAAREGRLRGTRQVLSPVLDLAREPRWGRTEECYSEDPYLASRMAIAAVFGLQGRSLPVDHAHLAVTLKHFAGHGQPFGGRNIAPVNYGERLFRETHLYPFEMAVKKAHALSIMASYNEWDGVPNHVNRKLLLDILRSEWGFDGYVMSDGGGLDVTYRDHLAAEDSAASGVLSLRSGVDYDLGSRGCYRALADQYLKGNIDETTITRAARNVLRVKFLAGLFDDPYIDVDAYERALKSEGDRVLALRAAHEAMVLLKNRDGLLPLDSAKIKTLAVIGPNAADIHLGSYSTVPMRGVSVLQGIQTFAKGKFKVVYAEGCKLTLNEDCHWRLNEKPVLNDPENDKKLIKQAVKTAKKSDAVILVLGENEILNREAWNEDHLGDTDNLNLPGRQNALAEALFKTGKPVVVLLINGRPLSINAIQENADAIVECWYLGQETGQAAANLLFGRVNPSGKLSVTFPRSVGQLPCYYNKKPSDFRHYILSDSSPLYPFGFGLSYTQFEYRNLEISPKVIGQDEPAAVTVKVTNTGDKAGDEIVQLYIHDLISLPTRPVKELKDFTRVHLDPGETKTVHFRLTSDKLEAFDMNMERSVPSGDFAIMVGRSSVEFLSDTLNVR